MGWSIEGSFDPAIKKSVVAVAPHTHWMDFAIASFTRRILKTEINFVGKKELFRGPLGWYMRWMGGAPLDRTTGQNKVESIAKIFAERDEFRMALAPEGTRKKVNKWKSGYYYIAHTAGVPIIPVSFDYKTKTSRIGKPFFTTGDIVVDETELHKFYEGVVGKVAAYT